MWKKSNKTPGIILLFTVIFALTYTGLFAQHGVKKKTETKTHIEYSLDTVMLRLNNMHLTLNRVLDFQDRGFDTRKVERQLPGINRTIELIRADLAGNTVLEYKQLLLFEFHLDQPHPCQSVTIQSDPALFFHRRPAERGGKGEKGADEQAFCKRIPFSVVGSVRPE